MGSQRTRSAARLACVSTALVLLGVSAAVAARPGDSPRIRTLQSRTHRALLDLYALDTRLNATNARLASLEVRTVRLRLEQAQLAQQIDAAKRTLTISQRQLGDNLSLLYKQGDVNTLAVVIGARSLDDAVTRVDDLNRVADQSKRVVEAAAIAQTRLAALRASLGAQRDALGTAVADARRTAASLEMARSDRLGFISHLRRERSVEVATLEAAAKRVERKSNALQAVALAGAAVDSTQDSSDPGPAAPATPTVFAGRTITVSSTGYALPGQTATGMPVGWGVVAVDPAVIPLGTRLTIPGYGEGVAADTGGGVSGNRIDVWFPTLAQAQAWGRRTLTITLH